MKKFLFLVFALLVLSSHDMFLKLDTYFLAPNSSAVIKLYNGTFQKSENVITRDRMIDVSLVGGGKRMKVDTTQWTERDSTMTLLSFKTGEPGTYVAGVSTKARNIEMDAEAFNNYLVHDGVIDMVEWRKENGAMGEDAVESYSKHVKTIYQVGSQKSDDWNVELGYPIEFIPLSNPYELHTGDELSVKLLRNGKPLVNQLVYADSELSAFGHSHDDQAHEHEHDHADADHIHDHEEGEEHDHSHDDGEEHSHDTGTKLRTNEKGEVTVELASDGIYYLRTIHLVNTEKEGLTHESNWATLTFEVAHDHGSVEADHVHEEETAFGIPSYAYWLGSLAIVGILFFYFYKNGK